MCLLQRPPPWKGNEQNPGCGKLCSTNNLVCSLNKLQEKDVGGSYRFKEIQETYQPIKMCAPYLNPDFTHSVKAKTKLCMI